jgi:colicin import membrane protein
VQEKSELDAEKVAKIKKAEEEWKAKKAEELKKHQRLKRRLLKKQDQEQDKQRVKKEDAQKHFIKWQEGWSDKMKDKMTEEKKKKLEEIEAKKAAAKEKSESAAAAFKGWTAKKVEDSKKSPQIKAPKKAGSKTDENGNNDKHERLEAARDAYDNWLEYVEQREEEERFAEEERVLREMWRPPWYPAGIADF